MLAVDPRRGDCVATLPADSPFIYDQAVPQDNLLRRLADEADFSFARGQVIDKYNLGRGRPSIPIALFCRICFLQFLYNLTDREVIEACTDRLSFKLFLGVPVEAGRPCDPSSLTRIRKRLGLGFFAQFFEQTVAMAQEKGLLGKMRAVDSSKTLMNAAVVTASQLVQQICERLVVALQAVPVGGTKNEGQNELARLAAELAEIKGDTSWLLSDDLKLKRYIRWGQHAEDLLEYARSAMGETTEPQSPRWQRIGQLIDALAGRLTGATEQESGDEKMGPEKRKSSKRGTRSNKVVSVVDMDARMAADRKKKVRAGYKTHVSMDTKSEIITAVQVTPMDHEDGPVLPLLIEDEIKRGLEVEQVTADAAYSDGPVRQTLSKHNVTVHIPEPKPKPSSQGKYIAADFKFNSSDNTLTCPGGKTALKPAERPYGFNFYFSQAFCSRCPLKENCLPNSELLSGVKRGRTTLVNKHRALHDAAKAAQDTPEYQQAMIARLRVEGKQEEMLNKRGGRWARYRSLGMVTIQQYLSAAVTNLRRMAVLSLMSSQAAPEAG